MDEIVQHIYIFHSTNTVLLTGIFSLLGAIIGASITVIGNILNDKIKSSREYIRNTNRRKILIQMLEDDRFTEKWRNFKTLKHVIGADDETTKQLLIECGARASEDGQDIWGLLKFHPLDKLEQ